MLGKKTKQLLNDQVEAESFASQSYLAMYVYLGDAGYDGFAKFFFDRSEEERLHMMKVIGYLSDKNEKTEVRPIKDVKTKFDDVLDEFCVLCVLFTRRCISKRSQIVKNFSTRFQTCFYRGGKDNELQ